MEIGTAPRKSLSYCLFCSYGSSNLYDAVISYSGTWVFSCRLWSWTSPVWSSWARRFISSCTLSSAARWWSYAARSRDAYVIRIAKEGRCLISGWRRGQGWWFRLNFSSVLSLFRNLGRMIENSCCFYSWQLTFSCLKSLSWIKACSCFHCSPWTSSLEISWPCSFHWAKLSNSCWFYSIYWSNQPAPWLSSPILKSPYHINPSTIGATPIIFHYSSHTWWCSSSTWCWTPAVDLWKFPSPLSTI